LADDIHDLIVMMFWDHVCSTAAVQCGRISSAAERRMWHGDCSCQSDWSLWLCHDNVHCHHFH